MLLPTKVRLILEVLRYILQSYFTDAEILMRLPYDSCVALKHITKRITFNEKNSSIVKIDQPKENHERLNLP